MSKIIVAGQFEFSDAASKFLFADGREIDLAPLAEYEPSRQILLAIMGVGFETVTKLMAKSTEEKVTDGLTAVVAESEAAMQAAAKRAEEFAAKIQGQVGVGDR